MSQKASGGMDALQVMIVSFILAGAAAAVLLTNFNGQGRLWDKLMGRQDEWGASPASGIVKVEAPAETGSRMMLINDIPNPDAAAAKPAVRGAAPAAAPATKPWAKHLTTTLAQYDIKGPATQHSNASASVTDAPAAAAPAATPVAAPVVSVAASGAAPAPAATAQPSYVNYGGTTRSDIMSSGAGPVYNFKGKR